MNLSKLLDTLDKLNIQLWLDNDQLRFKAPQGAMTDSLKVEVVAAKKELIQRLQKLEEGTVEESFCQPFPQTPIQQAYLVGRSDALNLGGVAANSYLEFERESVDFIAAQVYLNTVIKRHEMLRTVLLGNSQQVVLESVPEYHIPIVDHSQLSEREQTTALEKIRKDMGEKIRDPHVWPLFDMQWVVLADGIRLHSCVDLIGLDAWSCQLFFREWFSLLEGDESKPLPEITFQQCLQELTQIEKVRLDADWEYWDKVLPLLPPAPNLPKPLAKELTQASTKFTRLQTRIEKEEWQKFKQNCQHYKVTPTSALSTLFAHVLSMWSRNEDLSLNFTLFNRPPIHPDINQVLGEFTNNTLVSFSQMDKGFIQQVRNTQHLLLERLEHSSVAGVDLLRKLARQHQDYSGSMMPVVITSLLMADDLDLYDGLHWDQVYGISQTPQVALDHQLYQEKGGLTFNWDIAESGLDLNIITDAFHCYGNWIRILSKDIDQWEYTINRQQNSRSPVQVVADNYHYQALSNTVDITQHFWSTLEQHSNNTAIIWSDGEWSYGQLAERIVACADQLRTVGVKPADRVLVQLEKGPLQIVAVFATLYVGAIYVPIADDLPEARISNIGEQTQPTACIVSHHNQSSIFSEKSLVTISINAEHKPSQHTEYKPYQSEKEKTAYIIFTSGSTGQPKGVTVSHGAVQNTLDDMIQRFGLNATDRIFALSALNFDLSVYDVFATLSKGAALVLPDVGQERNPEHWYQCLQLGQVTVWNSVPTLLQMLLTWCSTTQQLLPDTMRLFLVSGDWVPIDLLDILQQQSAHECHDRQQLIALGGATEAAIWSNWQDVSAQTSLWKSVPYGQPLTNQYYRVLDKYGADRPAHVPGQLYIGGAGLAQSYWGDHKKTAESFVTIESTEENKQASQERLYKTGDLGVFWQDGTLEFLGRSDTQIKLGGHRIELGEITAVVEQHPTITRATTILNSAKNGVMLVVYAVLNHSNDTTIKTNEHIIKQYCMSHLPRYMLPGKVIFIEQIPLSANGKVDQSALPAIKNESNTDVNTLREHEQTSRSASTSIHRVLAHIFQTVLNQRDIDPHTNFFELGMTSLQLITAHGELAAAVSVDVPVIDFFTYTTLNELEQHINELQANLNDIATIPVKAEINTEYA
jgi:pyochelin synthetase